MRYLGMTAAVLAGLAAACGGTEPDQPLQVTVSAPARAAVTENSPSLGVRVTCQFTITARASGGAAGDYARWDGASVDIRDGAIFRPQEPGWSTADVAAFFGAERIAAGDVQRGTARVHSNADQFGVAYEFRYRLASGEPGTTSLTTVCE
jgi:hypothetical protein